MDRWLKGKTQLVSPRVEAGVAAEDVFVSTTTDGASESALQVELVELQLMHLPFEVTVSFESTATAHQLYFSPAAKVHSEYSSFWKRNGKTQVDSVTLTSLLPLPMPMPPSALLWA